MDRWKSPDNPAVTSFPPRSRYGRAPETPGSGRQAPEERCAARRPGLGAPGHPHARTQHSCTRRRFTQLRDGPSARSCGSSLLPPAPTRARARSRYLPLVVPRTGQDSSLADVPAAAAASRLRALSRSVRAPGDAAGAKLRWVLRSVSAAHFPAASSGAAGTRRRGRRPHLLLRLLPGSRSRPARRDAARAGGAALEPGRRVLASGRASA